MRKDSDSETYFQEYAEAAGLRPTDMPSGRHPLLENDDEVKSLGDLVDVREDLSPDDAAVEEWIRVHDPEDVSADIMDFDADARTRSAPDDADDVSYLTRQDFVEAMNATDPDPNAGRDADEFIADEVEEYRTPDLSGTVTGIARGTATHLPQDIGAQGFQIEDPEADHDPNLDPAMARRVDVRRRHVDPTTTRPEDDTPGHDNLNDGDVIPTTAAPADSRDDALDGTRRIR